MKIKLTESKMKEILREELEFFNEQQEVLKQTQEPLTEAGIWRVLDKYFDTGFMIISADRSFEAENGGREPTSEEAMAQKQKNNERRKEMKLDLKESKFGFIPVYGGYQEVVKDPKTGEPIKDPETDKEKKVEHPNTELSFIVPALLASSKKTNVPGLKKLGMQLCAKYNQDSFLFKPPRSEDESAYFFDRTGKVEDKFDNVVANDLEQIYFTKMRKGESNRFSFKEQEQLNENTAFALYFTKPPYDMSSALKRRGEIFYRFTTNK